MGLWLLTDYTHFYWNCLNGLIRNKLKSSKLICLAFLCGLKSALKIL